MLFEGSGSWEDFYRFFYGVHRRKAVAQSDIEHLKNEFHVCIIDDFTETMDDTGKKLYSFTKVSANLVSLTEYCHMISKLQ
jgi:hypothetical protein